MKTAKHICTFAFMLFQTLENYLFLQASKLQDGSYTRMNETSYTMTHLLGHFLILAVGVLIGVLSLITEIIGHRCKQEGVSLKGI